jgi:phage gp29-like protein
VDSPEFRLVLRHMMDALGKGFSVIEIMWTFDEGLWKPGAYRWRDPKYFTFDYVSRTEVRLAEMGEIDGLQLPPAKFIVHTPELKSGIPIRGGFAWLAVWSWLFKQYTLKDWVSFLDIFGMPIRVGKYHPTATADERRKLLTAVSRIAVDAAAIIPESMAIEFLESKGFADKPFQNMGEYLDKQMSKAILGQTMTTDAQSGGLAQAKVHDEVRIDILEDDASDAEVTINRDLIRWFVQLNFGAQAKAPYVRFPVAEPQDIAVQATALAQLVPLGLKVSQQEVLDKIGFTKPDEGDDLLTPPAGAAPKAEIDPDTSQAVRQMATASQLLICPCGCGRPLSRTAFNAEGPRVGPPPHDAQIVESQRLVDDALSDWREISDPLLAQLLRLADGASSLEEVLARANAASLDMQPLIDRLSVATAISRGLGDVKD